MGKRSRRRTTAPAPEAPTASYVSEDGASVLVLRGVLTPKTRAEYARVVAGDGRPAATREDAWQRAVEFLFERLAVTWTVAGVEWTGQKDLLARLRAATTDERRVVRTSLREHCTEFFPELEAP